MTPVGHSLTGIAIGLIVMPREFSWRAKASTLVSFVLLANLPDFAFPGWGHDRYDISHSIFVTGVLAMALVLLLRAFGATRRVVTPGLLAGGVAAWYSHLLLDTFYNHGKGLAMFWPLSDARLALPIPWFTTMDPHHLLSIRNATVFGIEGLCYGGIVLGAIAYRSRMSKSEPADPGHL